MKYILNSPSNPPGLLRKLAALIMTAALVGLVLMFSAVLFVIIVVIGTIAWAYLWWKTRELRKHIRDFQAQARARAESASNDAVFEGEVIREVDSRNER